MNCCANWNSEVNGVARSRNGGKLYTRLFAECKVAIPDLQHLMVDVNNNVQAMTTAIRDTRLRKELSHIGFVSMTLDQAAQFYKHGMGNNYARLETQSCAGTPMRSRPTIFLVDKDLGTVAYSSWIRSVLDQGTMYDLLKQTTNEESLANIVEMVLGFFEVMSYFQHELPMWKDVWKIEREFEQSIVRHLAGNASKTTGQNRRRNRPPTKEVLDIINMNKPKHPYSLVIEQVQPRVQKKGVREREQRLRPSARSESELSTQRKEGGEEAVRH